jgi:hypothetical protein
MKEIKNKINMIVLYEELFNKLDNQLHWRFRANLEWELFDEIYNGLGNELRNNSYERD